MRLSESVSGASSRARRSRLAVMPLLCVGCALVPVLAGGRPGESALHGYGASWQPVGLVSMQSGATTTSSSPQGAFRIAGAVGGLYPGASAPLVLTVYNPQQFAIVVTSISTTVGSPSASCLASNLAVATFSGQLTVAAQASAHVSVPVALSQSALDACQGANFPLNYSGLAHKA